MNQIAITLDGRTVVWNISQQAAAAMLSHLVQSLGPAHEEKQ